MSYFMTDEQELLKQAVADFCMAPETQVAIEADRAQGGFPHRSWDLLAKNGFAGMAIPEEYGTHPGRPSWVRALSQTARTAWPSARAPSR